MKEKKRPLGLYIHIPFCRSKCAYCDFYSLPDGEAMFKRYTAALRRHLTETAPSAALHQVDTIYFGGGTPSLLGHRLLLEILDTILVSAGKVGYQVELAPADLIALVGAGTADLTVDP